MKFTWHDPQRAGNLREHGLGFEHEIHLISFRKATKGEAQRYFDEVGD